MLPLFAFTPQSKLKEKRKKGGKKRNIKFVHHVEHSGSIDYVQKPLICRLREMRELNNNTK